MSYPANRFGSIHVRFEQISNNWRISDAISLSLCIYIMKKSKTRLRRTSQGTARGDGRRHCQMNSYELRTNSMAYYTYHFVELRLLLFRNSA